jgi:hypothetical protein
MVFKSLRRSCGKGPALYCGGISRGYFGFRSKPDRTTPLSLCAVLVFLGLVSGLPAPAVAQRAIAAPHSTLSQPTVALASHRATYAITLVRATQRDGVRTASGSTTYTLTDRCDGYTLESSMRLELGLSNGSQSVMEQKYAAWEAKDNRSSTFRMLTHENGRRTTSYRGKVTLNADGSGTATYEGDQTTTYKLPPGTLLSTAHMAALLADAGRGDTFINRTVIDGSFDDGPYRIAAVAGPRGTGPLQAADKGGLESGPVQPVTLAYFPLQSNDETPNYEVTMSLYPNGVAKRLVQDFGNFTLSFDLVKAEPVTATACP